MPETFNLGSYRPTVLQLGESSKNSSIVSFDELILFTGLKTITDGSLMNNGAFADCSSMKSLKIPPTVNRLGQACFYNCSSLMTIGDDLSTITFVGSSSFYNCTSYANELVLPNLTSLGYAAFMNSGITKVSNLGYITTIPDASLYNAGVFYNCKDLDYVILPSTLTHLGKSSLGKNTALKVVICYAATPPAMPNTAFNDTNSCIVYVPDDSVSAYQEATNWNTLSARIKPLSELV